MLFSAYQNFTMAEPQLTWIVRWNVKLYDAENRYVEGLRKSITVHQSKGRARMRVVPHVGDNVVVAWKGRIRMRGTVTQGFVAGTEHQTDNANLGNNRPHAEPEYYATIELRSVVDPVRIPFTGRQTWVRRNL